ncbi:hypothetical protein CK203_095047 [Vitis vinifera]|uniref:Uncharacterized protein n=1 Tax=Vitis vinifera TaxID=29760 RepID=A0A438C6Z5_VITVI|nr:hypothetical protein CK203_095047 [Vitis vinifera]
MLMSLPSKVCLHQLKLLSHHQGFNPSIPRVPTFHKLNNFSQFHHHHRHLRFCSINGHAGVRLLTCQMVMTTLPTMKTQVQRAKMVKENCTHQKSTSYLPYNAISLSYSCLTFQSSKETEEIWNFWNIILWTPEYCILSYNVSLGMVSK